MECYDCEFAYYHLVNEGDVDFECTAPNHRCPFNPPEPEVPGVLEYENNPVHCSWCGWDGATTQLNSKQIINPKTLQDEGVPSCPRCGSHTTLEY